MIRETFNGRSNYLQKLRDYGFDYHTVENIPYWQEKAGYKLTKKQVNELYAATKELSTMCLSAVSHVIENNLFDRLKIPESFVPLIKKSWERDDFTFYGRFDLVMKDGHIKMYEYNADTPTSFLEASLIQHYWKEDRGLTNQFNSIHEASLEQWEHLLESENPSLVHFACVRDSLEDYRNTEYIMDLAKQAGLAVKFLWIDEIGTDGENLFDMDERQIEYLFKLYPWEFLVKEEFSKILLKDNCRLIEPAWKMILSNKGLLVILSEMYPDHPLLLKTSFDPQGASYVKKPILSREGANISLVVNGDTIQTKDGVYGEEGFVYQEFCSLLNVEGFHPVIGSWIVGDEPVGIGIREDEKLITGNTSFFVSHYFE